MSNQLIYAPLDKLSEGRKYTFYESGTTTPLTVYEEIALTTAHSSPIEVATGAVPPLVFFDRATEAKCVVTDSNDASVTTIDPVPVSSTTGAGASQVSFSPISGNAATNVQTAIANIQPSVNTLGDAATKGVSGVDATAITGTAGAENNLAKFNADGDLVDGSVIVIDEDDMVSDSATALPTQQSVKAYADAVVTGVVAALGSETSLTVGGSIVKFGRITGGSSGSHTFGTAFPTKCSFVALTGQKNGGNLGTDTTVDGNPTATGFSWQGGSSDFLYYIAIGD